MRAGFTLVEVLVALLIFAMLAAAGVAVLSVTVDNRRAIQSSSERTAALQRTRSILRADLAQAADRRVRDAEGRPVEDLMSTGAEGDLLRLTRRGWGNPSNRARPSIQQVQYAVVDGRLERRVHARLDGDRPGAPQVLFDGVRDASVTFIDDGTEAPVWNTTPERPLPDAIRIDLTLDGYGPVSQVFLVAGGRR